MIAHLEPQILVIDDDDSWCKILTQHLRMEGYPSPIIISSYEEALQTLQTQTFPLAIINVSLHREISDYWKVEWISLLKQASKQGTRVIVVTAMDKSAGVAAQIDILKTGYDYDVVRGVYFKTDIDLYKVLARAREIMNVARETTKNQENKLRRLSFKDRERLIEELMYFPGWANGDRTGERSVLRSSGVPESWINTYYLSGTPAVDAPNVIVDLEKLGHLEDRPDCYALGALVDFLLRTTPHVEGKFFLAYLIEHYSLITDSSYLQDLREHYDLLMRKPLYLGWDIRQPQFEWHGPQDPHELERIWSPRAPFLDVVFLERGARVARSVCRIESLSGDARGTGFLIGPNLALTNCHVVATDEDAKVCQVRLGYCRDETGQIKQGEVYRVRKLVRHSPENELDYAVLEIEDMPGNNPAIGYMKLKPMKIAQQNRVYIIQHPQGEPQKVVLQENRVTYVSQRRVQYLTNTQKGSSGSPVCNENWEVMALHHSGAPLPASPGSVEFSGNEGIPITAILKEIQDLLV